ncbi:MAG: roadblock/LC7 domain-containing protein [Candidatus Rehaiarchaeum fermentans]|nr:roadblock/LC7 domain-containing protein [Candidatus Rehaiarchaeum fermentans]MCW1297578.1 roadblock/LC7 domain-containing protein [Candidatus Rehaiarchaeum fermentans]MCW1302572.1 roadblock/LC7 domain-containing protein [Candidatus Rehaiarchaeum fermentans]MCW1311741.1 roadblock/LC7 domain-containing protein [Candidatus Rehaiarchaeum fermentans]
MSKQDDLRNVLEKLNSVGGVKASAILYANGIPIMPLMPPNVDANTFCAMVGSMVGAAEEALKALGSNEGDLQVVITEAATQMIMAVKVSKEVILASLLEREAQTGLILLELNKASKQIQTILAA